MEPNVIFHFTTLQEWEHAQDLGFYQPKGFLDEGFIHCAKENQVNGVLERYFKGHQNLVKLVIDPQKLTHRIQYDLSETLQQDFPHIYGPLNIEAVVQVVFVDPITSEE